MADRALAEVVELIVPFHPSHSEVFIRQGLCIFGTSPVQRREDDMTRKLEHQARHPEPIFDAHRGHTDETWRIDRLRGVFVLAAKQIQSESFDGSWDGAIRLVYDRKGNLTVFWRSEADFLDFGRFVKVAWNAHDEYMPIQHISPANMPFDVAAQKLREAASLLTHTAKG